MIDQNGQQPAGDTRDQMTEFGDDVAAMSSGPQRLAQFWIGEINAALKRQETWEKRCRKIIKKYRSERRAQNTTSAPDDAYQILWANIQTVGPAIYSKTPKPEIGRRFKDDDQVARVASEATERTISGQFDQYDFDQQMFAVREEFQLVGRSVLWVTYEPQTALRLVPTDPLTGLYPQPLPPDVIVDQASGQLVQSVMVDQRVMCERVIWDDFLTGFGRRWDDVTWVARRIYLTRREMVQQFGEEIGRKVPLDYHPGGDKKTAMSDHESETRQAIVYEVWDKPTKRVLWISLGYAEGPLAVKDDPLGLSKFFPCPRPLMGTTGPDSIIPVPDYVYYEDQADQIDMLTSRISLLSDALRVRGVYAGKSKDVAQRLLQAGAGNEMIPVDDWQGLIRDAGGLKGLMDFLPIDVIAGCLQQCIQARAQIIQDIYAITGISDIVRGASDPNETATAQNIKAQWGGLRVRDKQQEMQRFVRDVVRIMAEIIAEHWTPEILARQSNITITPEQEMQGVTWEAIKALLADQQMRDFRIDIETDSMIAADEQAEKQARVEFLTSVSQFLPVMQQIVSAAPEAAKMTGDMLMFLVRGFRAGRELEASIEQAVQQIEQRVQQQAMMAQQQQQMMMQQQAMAAPPPQPSNVVPMGGPPNAIPA